MKKTIALIKREYMIRVKTKGFLIGTILMPVFLLFIALAPALFMRMDSKESRTVAIVDRTNKVADRLISQSQEEQDARFQFNKVDVSSGNMEQIQENLQSDILNKNIDAYIIIPENVYETNDFQLYTKNVSNFSFNSRVEWMITNVVVQQRLANSGLDPEKVNKLNHHVSATTFKVGGEGAKKESSEAAFFANYFLVFMLYFSLILYGTFVMRGVIEDKTSRVIEVVISSTKPHQFMAGKIVGIGAAGLSQFLIWVLFAVLMSTFGLMLARQFNSSINEITLPSISIWVYVAFLAFFILGYFLYATVYAAIGSMVSSESEAQSLAMPVIFLLIISFMLMFAIIENPDGSVATILSLIPFFAPILMFFRISVQAAPLWQVLLSIVILLATLLLFIWITGKIFRTGILMYGKRPTLPELLKWLRYS